MEETRNKSQAGGCNQIIETQVFPLILLLKYTSNMIDRFEHKPCFIDCRVTKQKQAGYMKQTRTKTISQRETKKRLRKQKVVINRTKGDKWHDAQTCTTAAPCSPFQ